MRMANARSGEYQTAQMQQCDPDGLTPTTTYTGGKCSYCETMYKNLQYLENYLRNNTAKNSCNSCSTCLSFLLYMKQQTVPVPRFDPVNSVVYTTGQTMQQQNAMPSAGTAEVYTVQETITYQPVVGVKGSLAEKKVQILKKARTKSLSAGSRGKVMTKTFSSVSAPNKHEKSRPATVLTKRIVVSAKKKLKKPSVSKETSSKATPESSAAVMKNSASESSRPSTAIKRKRKASTIKSSLSKASSSKGTMVKHKVKSRTIKKKVKTVT